MLANRLQQRIAAKKTQLDRQRPLPTTAVQRLQEQLTVEWIYNSNAIEGNTLSLRETRLILEEGLTIGGKSLREHFEVVNHREAIIMVEQLAAEPIPSKLAANIVELKQLAVSILTRRAFDPSKPTKSDRWLLIVLMLQ